MYGFAFQGEGVGGMTGRDDTKVPLGVVIAPPLGDSDASTTLIGGSRLLSKPAISR
jgi:hypothetical protein